MTTVAQLQTCKNCRAEALVDPQWATWCERCDWGISQQEVVWWAKYGTGKFIGKRLRRIEANLTAEFAKNPQKIFALRPADTLSIALLSALFAFLVSLMPLGFWVIWKFGFSLISLYGLMVLLIGYALTVSWWTPTSYAHERSNLPELSAICDRVSDRLGAPRVTHLHLSVDTTCVVHRTFFRRNVTLSIGLALWAALSPAQQVALLAELLGLLSTRNVIFKTAAIRSLDALDAADEFFAEGPLIYQLVGLIPMTLATAFRLVIFRTAQVDFHRNDHSAAHVAGTENVLALLERMALDHSWERISGQFVRFSTQATDDHTSDLPAPYETFRLLSSEVPLRELNRQRRVEQLSATRIDYWIPSVHRRHAVLRQLPTHFASVFVSDAERQRVADELRPYFDAAVVEMRARGRRQE
jgi:hypothetical protein